MHLLLHIHLEEDIRVDTPGHAPMTVSTVAVPSMPKSPPAAGTVQVLIRVCGKCKVTSQGKILGNVLVGR